MRVNTRNADSFPSNSTPPRQNIRYCSGHGKDSTHECLTLRPAATAKWERCLHLHERCRPTNKKHQPTQVRRAHVSQNVRSKESWRRAHRHCPTPGSLRRERTHECTFFLAVMTERAEAWPIALLHSSGSTRLPSLVGGSQFLNHKGMLRAHSQCSQQAELRRFLPADFAFLMRRYSCVRRPSGLGAEHSATLTWDSHELLMNMPSPSSAHLNEQAQTTAASKTKTRDNQPNNQGWRPAHSDIMEPMWVPLCLPPPFHVPPAVCRSS